MIIGHRQCAIHRMLSRFRQYQSGQGGSGTAGQPPTVVITPSHTAQLIVDGSLELHATSRAQKPTAAFGNRLKIRILRLPGQPETRRVPRSITAITQPMQLHAERVKVFDRRSVLRVTAQQADSGKPKALTSGGERVQVVGMRTTETDDAFGCALVGRLQMLDKLEPLVAADQRIYLVKTQNRQFDTGVGKPVEIHEFKGNRGKPAGRGKKHWLCAIWKRIESISHRRPCSSWRRLRQLLQGFSKVTTRQPTANPD